ncbi:hypothetical protein BRC83_03080 [Halobacteriales archaeon QS_1_68_17]|nr:MAG: hypothetical protein BRC83_03080 [Halobacteriales archaeon QS_1_68_17]
MRRATLAVLCVFLVLAVAAITTAGGTDGTGGEAADQSTSGDGGATAVASDGPFSGFTLGAGPTGTSVGSHRAAGAAGSTHL